MSTLPDSDFDLEKLFLPAWAQEDAAASAKYAKYEGEVERPDRRGDRRGPRPPRREGGRDDRRRGPERRGPRPPGARGPEGAGQRPGGEGRPFGRRQEPRERREPPPPLPEIELALIPEEKGVDSLARQIKMTGRAYPLFDIAQMILQKPERHTAVFTVKKKPEGQPVQPLFVCALDDSLWLSEDEAVGHVLRKHFATFYQTERTPTEPPKGKYTFVAQCGLSGVVLGPPNYHDYQNQLRKLHAERFSRMPFEAFKARVRIVRDEEVVKKWVEDQSFKTEYICLNLPEPLRLGNMEAVEKHFRETHKENIIKQVDSYTLTGVQARNLRSHELARLFRSAHDDQRRFPLQIATVLSQQFAARGLQFFKVNKAITHVCVARPHHLDLAAAPVSEGVKRIVEFINEHPKCNRRTLVESLAPTPPSAPAPIPVTETSAPPAGAAEAGDIAPAAAPAAAATAAAQPTPEQTAVIADLHWLIHQGHVIEFANGILETAKKPLPKPPKPEKPAKTAEGEAAAPTAAETPAAPAEPAGGEGAPAAAAPAPAASAPGEETQAAPPMEEVPAAPATEPAAPAEPGPSGTEPAAAEAAAQAAAAATAMPVESTPTPPPVPAAEPDPSAEEKRPE